MKKTLLLAGVACLISATASNAMDYRDIKPIIGLDYAYSDADFKKSSKGLNNDFNSGVVEKVIKVTQTNGETNGGSILGGNFKLLDLLMNINKIGLFERLFSLFDGLFMKK